MTTRDMCDHLAALALAVPTSPDQIDPPEAFDDVVDQIHDRREDYAENLRAAWDGADVDPLLAEIGNVQAERAELDRQLRRLVAYAREFVGPRPYPLATLATAAGLGSHSSVRTFYGPTVIDEVAAITGAKPRRPAAVTEPARAGKPTWSH